MFRFQVPRELDHEDVDTLPKASVNWKVEKSEKIKNKPALNKDSVGEMREEDQEGRERKKKKRENINTKASLLEKQDTVTRS